MRIRLTALGIMLLSKSVFTQPIDGGHCGIAAKIITGVIPQLQGDSHLIMRGDEGRGRNINVFVPKNMHAIYKGAKVLSKKDVSNNVAYKLEEEYLIIHELSNVKKTYAKATLTVSVVPGHELSNYCRIKSIEILEDL
jgi:hypothetical protein